MNQYCAYSTTRRDAAKTRNYNNCKSCKTDRQKCTGNSGTACERCLKLGKTCSLLDSPSPTDSRPGKNTGMVDSTGLSNSRERDERHFGRILYVIRSRDGMGVELVHIKFGINRQEQVYRSQCDTNHVPVGPSVYLGPWIEFEQKLRCSTYSVTIQDMMEATDMEN